MSEELLQIRNEIHGLNEATADITFLEALVNNLVYCLRKIQKESEEQEDKLKALAINIVVTDILATKNQELAKAKIAKSRSLNAYPELFRQAKQLIVQDINQIIEDI